MSLSTPEKRADAEGSFDLLLDAVFRTDSLTGLPDRQRFESRLERALDRAQRQKDYRFAVCFLDLDKFKAVNDRFGHLVGDCVLREVARRLAGCVRHGDMVARFGGDEFTVLIDNLCGNVDAERVARRLLEQLQPPVDADGQPVEVGASVGVTIVSREYHRIEDLLRDADRAMYCVKAKGGGDFAIIDVDSESSPFQCRRAKDES